MQIERQRVQIEQLATGRRERTTPGRNRHLKKHKGNPKSDPMCLTMMIRKPLLLNQMEPCRIPETAIPTILRKANAQDRKRLAKPLHCPSLFTGCKSLQSLIPVKTRASSAISTFSIPSWICALSRPVIPIQPSKYDHLASHFETLGRGGVTCNSELLRGAPTKIQWFKMTAQIHV